VPTDAEMTAALDGAGADPSLVRCTALVPAVHAFYTAGVEEGRRRFASGIRRPTRLRSKRGRCSSFEPAACGSRR
jgi:hypothetical protein